MCLDFISRTPSCFGIDENMLEGENPLAFSLFLSSVPLFRKGILNLLARHLVRYVPTSSGFIIEITESGKYKVSLLKSEIARSYRKRTRMVISKFGQKSSSELTDLINTVTSRNRLAFHRTIKYIK